jgi:hypothetical protein
MTLALCFTCGETKFGAICPCTKCGVPSTGDMSLDIAFSDHNMSVKTLEDYGNVVRELNRRTQEPAVRFWTFIKFVSDSPDAILHAEPPAELRERIEHVLSLGPLPEVKVEKSPQFLHQQNEKERTFEIALPPEMAARVAQAFHPGEFGGVWTVDVELTDGQILSGFRIGIFEGAAFLSKHDKKNEFTPDQLKAVRQPFSVLHPFRARPWINLQGP